MHQADQQRTPAKAVRMRMKRVRMGRGFDGMAVGVNVNRAVLMVVTMDMNAVVPQPPQHVGAEADQHHADRSFERP